MWGCNVKDYRVRGSVYEMIDVKEGDFTTKLNQAVNFCKQRGLSTIQLPPGTHTMNSTFLLPDNFTLLGGERTVLQATIVETAKGGYPITIFDSPGKGVANVVVKGIIFDGNGGGRRKNLSQTEGSANTLRLRNSRNVSFIDCELRNHFSNIPAPYSAANFKDARSCVGLSIEGSERVTLKNFRLRSMPNEAIWFYNSKNLVVEEMTSIDHTQLSSHLTFWYCDTVRVENSYFSYERGGGSALNIESSNVRIAKNEFVNGRGIDISNEANFEDYFPENITIVGNKLTNVKYYGIIRNRSKRTLKNFVVRDNQISIDGDTGRKKGVKVMAIKTDDTDQALVQNNRVEFVNLQPDNDYIAFGSFGFNESGTTLRGNTLVGADYLYWGSTYVGSKTNSAIVGNDCTLRPRPGRPGAIYIYNSPGARAGNGMTGFRIENNQIKGSSGEKLLSIISEVEMSVKNLSVLNNRTNNGGTSIELAGQKIMITDGFELKSPEGEANPTLLLRKVNLPEKISRQIGRKVKVIKRDL